MGFIQDLLLPKELDLNAGLLEQAKVAREMVECLCDAAAVNDIKRLTDIAPLAARAREAKEKNMTELRDVFITSFDRESIFRVVTQLDWVSLSVKHFDLESQVYGIHSLLEYQPVFELLKKMALALEDAVERLGAKKPDPAADFNRELHDMYDEVVTLCATATAALLAQDDIKRLIRHKDMLLQLKEIAKRIHISSNSLEDMTIKVV